MRKNFSVKLASLAILFCLVFANQPSAAAQQPQTAENNPGESTGSPGNNGLRCVQRDEAGKCLYVVTQSDLTRQKNPASPQTTGGPDDFGYTWDNEAAYSWKDATSGGAKLSALTGINQQTGPISLPFNFRYYENSYNQMYVSTNGTIGFSGHLTDNSQQVWYFPRQSSPNNVIAPYWAPEDASTGGVYIKAGGVTPNRWYVVEWFQVRDYAPDSRLTFEVVLWEGGDFDFVYNTLNYGTGGMWGSGIGIENIDGLDGLGSLPFSSESNFAIHLFRPGPSARIAASPLQASVFGTPGGIVSFSQVIRNAGDLGTDTFELASSANWPAVFYAADGVTLLTDTNGNGSIDTGPLAQAASRKIMIKIYPPDYASIGQWSTTRLTFSSSLNSSIQKTVVYQAAIPAPFAQSYEQSGYPHVGLYAPYSQPVVVTDNASGSWPVVTTTPSGKIVQVWQYSYKNIYNKSVTDLYYKLLDQAGHVLHAASRLTDNRNASMETYDTGPGIAASPDGRISFTWTRELRNSSNSTFNTNIFYMIIYETNGQIALSPTNVTNFGDWVDWSSPYTRFYSPIILATLDNHLTLAWQKDVYDGTNHYGRIWYTVKTSTNATIKTVTQLDFDGNDESDPSLTALSNSNVLLTFTKGNNIAFARLDSSGSILSGSNYFPDSTDGSHPDAIQLSNGLVILAWSTWHPSIQYGVLDANINYMSGPFTLSSLPNSPNVCVTHFGNRAILTWGAPYYGAEDPNLYYALIDENGDILTPGMIFATDNVAFILKPPLNGQGNTYLPGANDSTPPGNPTAFTSSRMEGSWSSINTIGMSWSGAADTESGLDGYSVLWDNSPSTTPAELKNLGKFAQATTSPALADGVWYFHLRSVDLAGNWSGPVHKGPFGIDTTGPTNPTSVSSSDHTANAWSNDTTIDMSWSGAVDPGSGLDGYSIVWDQSPASLPDTLKDLDASLSTATSPALSGGVWYFHIRTVDKLGNWSVEAATAGPYKIDTVPPSSSARSPLFALLQATVTWSGADNASGIASYDIQVRDGPSGTWNAWLADTTDTQAVFTSGVAGHTYYFRSLAQDAAGNLQTNLSPNGDAHTTIAAITATGKVLNNRAQPVLAASINIHPAVLNSPVSGGYGEYEIFLKSTGAFTLTASRSDYGTLPSTYNHPITAAAPAYNFYLPPANETVANGGWETGSLSGWQPGLGITSTVASSAAHSGHYGLLIEAAGTADSFTAYISQTVSVPNSPGLMTLSWLQKAVQAAPGSLLEVQIIGSSGAITHTLSLTPGAWQHAWLDLSAFKGQAVTLRFGLRRQHSGDMLYLDEVSLGETKTGAYPVSLPIISR